MHLNNEQRDIVFNYPTGVIVNASPGTGKTTTLVARALYKIELLPKYKKIALITYTNAGTDEISSRLINHSDAFIGTIHRFCLKYILRPYAWIYDWGKLNVLSYENQLNFLESNKDIDLGDSPTDELSKIKKNLDGSFDMTIAWSHEIELGEVIERYINYLGEINCIDFNEILYRSYKIIDENAFVVRSLAHKFYEILIDEFQDTNIFQYQILKKINEIGITTFFMVGDEKQKILRFAGAIDEAFSVAQRDFNLPLKYLVTTYRSTNNIVEAYSIIFDNHPRINNESLFRDLDIKLLKKEFDYRNNKLDASINYAVDYLVDCCGVQLDEIAILSKTWFDSLNASSYLRQKYNIVGLGALPHPMKNVKDSTFELMKNLAKFRLHSSSKNLKSIKRSFEEHLNGNGINLDDEEHIKIINQLIKRFSEVDETLNLEEGIVFLQDIFDDLLFIEHNTFKIIKDEIKEEELVFWTIGKYFKTISNIDGILSTTIHQSKGLEFDAVILNQMNVGKVPHQNWNPQNREHEPLSEEDYKDGKNIFYVGLSRARKYIIILHNWKPSIFVEKLNEYGMLDDNF